MQDYWFARLDELAREAPTAITGERILGQMEEIAAWPGGFDALVERYAPTENPLVARSLAFLLAGEAAESGDDAWPRLMTFLRRLRRDDDDSTLINALTAIQRHLIVDRPIGQQSDETALLYSFLMRCLDRSSLIVSGVIAVVMRLYEDGLLPVLFQPEQVLSLRAQLNQLSQRDDAYLNAELADIEEFLQDADRSPEQPS